MGRIGKVWPRRSAWRQHGRAALMAVAAACCSFTAGFPSASCQDGGAAADRLILLDDAVITVPSLRIHDGAIHGPGVPAGLRLDDLRRIERPGALVEPAPASVPWVELRGGSRIAAKSVSIAAEKCRVLWRGQQTLELPLDAIRAIRFETSASAPFDKARAQPKAEQDRVLVRDDSGAETIVAGLVDSLTSEQMQLDVGTQRRALPAASIAGIVFAEPAAAEARLPIAVHLSDESVLLGSSLELSDSSATLLLPGEVRVPFRWAEVTRVIVRSGRVAFLSELQPLAEEQRPIVTPPYPTRRDLNASGLPLRLGSQVYEKGLGVHAFSKLTFAAGGQWDRFLATIGLAPDEGQQGDCVFKVLADGKVIFERRVRAADAPQVVDLPIAGCEQVMLVVEPGEDLDLGDHANWCDARFIRDKR